MNAQVFFKPTAPPYDALEWERRPFAERGRMVCDAWAVQGYGTPVVIYLLYLAKIALYVGGWFFFCRFTPGMGHLENVSEWWARPEAFQKAILFSMLFEVVGLGCGSGPLTGRYMPPIGGVLYFLRPGTTKLPVFEGAPIIGGKTRSALDVALYGALLACTVAALVAEVPPRGLFVVVALLLPALGVLDRTIFLAARGEHYFTTIAVFALTTAFVPGAKALHAALWFWAGFSKLNHHFPAVVGVMTSNSPVTRFAFVRKLMYRSYPDDLNPSRLAAILGHAGTLLEMSVPAVLLAGHGPGDPITLLGLALMLLLHGFITSNVPMGVPLEWNVMMVYGGAFLFYAHGGDSILAMSPDVAGLVGFMGLALPLLGNLFPAQVPFLLAMRYYAGNWAYSVWLFERGSHVKLERLKKSAGWVFDQLSSLYDERQAVGMVGRVMAFRLMHLHGRVLARTVPLAVDDLARYRWLDGELVAGMVLGWNFGDGHLHREQLLRSVQEQCGFAPGELRVVMVEAQPLGRPTLHYRVHDASTGLLTEGLAAVPELRARQPWG